MKPRNEIHYLLAIPEGNPAEVTPFQGFAAGLIWVSPLLHHVVRMPADIVELTMRPENRLVRRRAGEGDWMWSPVDIDNLERPGRRPIPQAPFMVVLSDEREVARRVARWRRNLSIRPLHVSTAEGVGAITVSDFTIDRLQRHCLSALEQAHRRDKRLDIDDAQHAIRSWRPFEERPSSLRLHSHGVTQANQMVLLSTGERLPDDEGGILRASPYQDYVRGVSESVAAVRALQAETLNRPVYALAPPRPDTILLAPAMFSGIARSMANVPFNPVQRRAFRSLVRQRGYTHRIAAEPEDMEDIAPVGMLRGAELKLQTAAIGMRAASTLAATIRLPYDVNRIGGVVGQLARHLRHYDDRLPDVKTARVFRIVQEALRNSIPGEHFDLIRHSVDGVKIVADAPLEWIPVGPLPLGVKYDVSRVNTTPGNLLIDQLRPRLTSYIPADAFRRYLVVSMFEHGDAIADHMRDRLQALDEDGVEGIAATANSVDEFIAAVNAYDGPILIVDSHGGHDGDIGRLFIGGQSVDVSTLAGRIRLPPIVILSACDTHPFDRTHATVANGFLLCGAQAVLATVLPIRSQPAGMFVVRLLLRAISFGNIMNNAGRGVAWTNIVGGALRMQLASDIVRDLGRRGMLPEDQLDNIQLSANMDLNPHNRPDWLERLAERCQEEGGFGPDEWDRVYSDILAASDVIRYTHVGNPEAIVIADERVMRRIAEEAGVDMRDVA